MDPKIAQTNLVHELFVRTADENYVTARWCVSERLETDFLWLSVHALEKYMKAVILLNGGAARDQGHDIEALYREVEGLSPNLLPATLDRPDNLEVAHWWARTPTQFFEYLHTYGNADNRYLLYGYDTRREDCQMLDRMVFAIRRMICRLDDTYIKSTRLGAPLITYREVLQDNPRYYPRLHMPLDNLIASKKDSSARFAALNMNLWFAPEDFEHQAARYGSSMRAPVIARRILEPLESDDPARAAEAIVAAEWLLANVRVPGNRKDPGVKGQIEDAIQRARKTHGL